MAQRQGSVSHDPSVPNVARMYDHWLGGTVNFPADREACERAEQADPSVPMLVRANRAFVRRATAFLAREGVDQFLDLGSGLPTQRNVHEIAEEINPDARIVYVDDDPVVKAHSDAVLKDHRQARVFQHDLRDIDTVLRQAGRVLDLSRPMAVLCTATLHFVPDEDAKAAEAKATDSKATKPGPDAIMARVREALASGSYLALTHASADERPEEVARMVAVYRGTSKPGTPRTAEQVLSYLGDFELVDPLTPTTTGGLVWVSAWRPEEPVDPERAADTWFYAGVARKP